MSALKSGNQAVSTGSYSHTFSITGLVAGTDYDVYVVAQDDEASPNIQTVIKRDVRTIDTTSPVFESSSPTISSITQNGFSLAVDINESGTIYYVVVPNGESAPSSAQVKVGQKSNGSAALSSGSQLVSTGSFTHTFAVLGLLSGTHYDVYVVAQDDESTPNVQSSATRKDVRTVDNVAPVFESSSPTISGITPNGFSLVVDINESGTIYYVVVPNGESAPNSAQVKAGQKSNGSAALSSGSQLVSTGSYAHTFAVSGLLSGTDYDVYVVAQDDESTPNVQSSATRRDVLTVDNIAPVFESSTPTISAITPNSFSLAADINEGGTLFYVVVPDGESAPSSAQVKAGQKSNSGAALKSGSQAVSSGGFNHTFSVTGLADNGEYDVYVVAQDDESTPNVQAAPSKRDLSTPDVTPPVFENSSPSINTLAFTSFNLYADIDEAGTLYYVVVPDGEAAPSSAQVKAGQKNNGTAAIKSGNQAVSSGNFDHTFGVTGLNDGVDYDVYVIAQDAEATPNVQSSPTKVDVATNINALVVSSISANYVSPGESIDVTLNSNTRFTAADYVLKWGPTEIAGSSFPTATSVRFDIPGGTSPHNAYGSIRIQIQKYQQPETTIGAGVLRSASRSDRSKAVHISPGRQHSIDDTAILNLSAGSEGTFEAWVKAEYSQGTAFRGIVSKFFATSLVLYEGQLYVRSFGATSGVFPTGVYLNDNNWHHVALAFKIGETNGSTVYVDGDEVYSFTVNYSNPNAGITIGAEYNGAPQFLGYIDEVRIWNTRRTLQNIRDTFLDQISDPQAGLLANYHYDNIGQIFDYSGNERHISNVAIGANLSSPGFVPTAPKPTSISSKNLVAGQSVIIHYEYEAIYDETDYSIEFEAVSNNATTLVSPGVGSDSNKLNLTIPSLSAGLYRVSLVNNTLGLSSTFPELVDVLSNGGTLTQTVELGPVNYGATQWGDLDGDGDLDILNRGLFVRNDGSNSFTNVSNITGPGFGRYGLADIDNDGDLDVVTVGSTSYSYVLKNNGSGAFSSPTNLGKRYSYGHVSFADYDRDGDLDFLITGDDFTGVGISSDLYQNNGGSDFSLVTSLGCF